MWSAGCEQLRSPVPRPLATSAPGVDYRLMTVDSFCG
jgi:hypothetical protein